MLLPILGFVAAACAPVHSEKITGRDLAKASPVFAAAPPDAVLGYAPAPGHTRVIDVMELRRLTGIGRDESAGLLPVCFEWVLEELPRDRIEAAMRTALENEGAAIEIMDTSRYRVPHGEVVFPRSSLGPADAAGVALWRGHIRYAEKRRFEIWARVKVSVPFQRVVAAGPIHAGDLIEAAHLRLETGEGSPDVRGFASRMEEVAGRVARRSIAGGAPILLTSLAPARDVARGDSVKVEVRSGLARIALEGKAESAGAVGDTIAVRNLASGKSFRARVEAPGRVSVEAGRP